MDAKTLIVIIVIAAAGIAAVWRFLGLSRAQKIANLKEWLKWAVSQAERLLGSGTGELKLRLVYDMAVTAFPWVGRLVDFEDFSVWVDEALEWLGEQLENDSVKALVEGSADAE